jgi:hypothetical protein
MVEHVLIQDSQRHEAKGASTALAGQVIRANGDGTTSFVNLNYDELSNKPAAAGYTFITSGFSSAASQLPAAVDTVKQVEFGAGSVTTDVTISSAGAITFNTAGDYNVDFILRFGRTGGAGTAIVLNRLLMNGVQYLNSNVIKLIDSDTIVPFSTSLMITATAGQVLTMEIARDSGGINNGGLYRILPTALPWSLSPSATVLVTKHKSAS